MQYGGDADLGAEPLGIGGDLQRRLGGRLHQQIVDDALVLIRHVAQLAWQRVDDVEVGRRQQLGLTLGEPFACRRALALRAMPIAAAIEADGRMAALAVLAARNVAAERRRAAALDCTHHLQLAEAHVPAVGVTPSGAVVAEDVRDLDR